MAGKLDCTELAKCRSVADHRTPGISVSNDAWYRSHLFPLVVMSAAAVYRLWRGSDPRNDSRHTSVLVLVGNRHRRRHGIASLRIAVSGSVVLDRRRAQQRLGQWSPAPLPQSGNANDSIWRSNPVSLRVRAHRLLRSAGLHHQLPEFSAPAQHSRSSISPCEEL